MRLDTYTHHNYNQNKQHHEERSSNQCRYGDGDRHHLYHSTRPQDQYSHADQHYNNNNDPQHSAHNMSMLNTLELIGSLQSQIIGLCSQPLQQATLTSINAFGVN